MMGPPLGRTLEAVFAIGIQESVEVTQDVGSLQREIGTGFLYLHPKPGTSGQRGADFRLWMVTCRHVVEQARVTPASMAVRFNFRSHERKTTFGLPNDCSAYPRWYFHPRSDVAVAPMNPDDLELGELQWQAFAEGRNVIDKDRIAQWGILEGSEVLFVGFPVGWRDARRDYPIVRHGIIAQIQGCLAGDHDTFLVDGSGFPGNSGGPVVLAQGIKEVSGEEGVPAAGLIGMVSERTFSDLETGLSDLQLEVKETADLIEVILVDDINDTIVRAMAEEAEHRSDGNRD